MENEQIAVQLAPGVEHANVHCQNSAIHFLTKLKHGAPFSALDIIQINDLIDAIQH